MTTVIISTGGTIASTDSSESGANPELSGDNLVDSVPGLGEIDEIKTYDFSNIPSPHFKIDHMAGLVDQIKEFDSDPSIDGIVVTQGTDILEESAYFVDLCYGGSTPVVFTGAMRNPSTLSPDGPRNLFCAVRFAVDAANSDVRTFVCFNDRVYSARHVTKVHSTNVDTFRVPEFGPIATIDENRVTWHFVPNSLCSTFDPDPDLLTNDVHAVVATADMSPKQISVAEESTALVLAATGAGHIPPGIIPSLENLRDTGIPIIATTRCPEGRLARDTYGFEGSEKTLQRLGCYYSERNLQKTRIKTIVACAADALDEAFSSPE